MQNKDVKLEDFEKRPELQRLVQRFSERVRRGSKAKSNAPSDQHGARAPCDCFLFVSFFHPV